MSRKRIRYSELAKPSAKRVSTPVEIARALAAERRTGENLIIPSEKVVILSEAVVILSEAKDLLVSHQDEKQILRSAQDDRGRDDKFAELLVFRIGSESYAAELARIEEVIDLPAIHYVPEMPPAMLGVVTVRGAFTSVYSPADVLGVPLAQRRAALIFHHGPRRTGILVDDVDDAVRIDLRQLRFPIDSSAHQGVVIGVVRQGTTLVSLVDVDALIAACRGSQLAEAS